jgi:hypothetical protein
VGVFLRWGVFGIIAVAALVYAYNALGHLADRHRASPATVVAPPVHESEPTASGHDVPASVTAMEEKDAIPDRCVVELDIARRAVESRSIGEPLDRLLRIQEIAWEKDDRKRERLTQLATRWYAAQGPVDAARLRRDVVKGCMDATR